MIATTLIEWFTRFPALWAVAAIVITFFSASITAVVMFLIWKKYGPKRDEMSAQLAESQKLQLDSLERTMRLQIEGGQASLRMQKEHYESELKECREKTERDVAAVVAEKKAAEKTLHDRRNDWNTEKLAMTAEIEQLKSRPNVESLFNFEKKSDERREAFYLELGQTMSSIRDSITNHDNSVAKKIEPMMEVLTDLLKQSKKQMRVLTVLLRTQKKVAAQ
jgi:hypothetical protein